MSWNHILCKALTIAVVIAVCPAGSALAQRTVYVSTSVAATGDGTQAAPFKTIAEALALTDPDLTVLVAGGIYVNEPPNTRILSGQTLIGSYDSSFTTSDPSVTPTIIDMARLPQQEQDRTFHCQAVTSWTIENLTIRNSSSGESSDTDNGGAIYIRNGSHGAIRGVTFFNCATKFEGGVENGPAREGGAVCIRDGSTVVFEDCVFDSCTAVGGGGAVRMRNAGSGNNVKFHRCLFTNCGARGNGSVIDDGDGVSQIEIVNCIFANNGADVLVPSGIAPSTHLIRVSDRRALIYNCTFVGNNNPDGSMFNIANSGDAGAMKQIVNCIVASNTIADGGSIFSYASDYDDATTLQNNLFFSNSGLDPLDPAGASIIGVNGNIAGDPQFTDAANGDYYLKAGSPGEDAGQTLALVPDDFARTPRPVGSAYDIGALEGQPRPKPLSPRVPSVKATASSQFSADRGPEKTVDGSGLNALDQHDTAGANMWLSGIAQEPPVWIQYEFDTVYKLDQMWVWNSNDELEWLAGLGVKTATVEYSTDGATWTALANVPQFDQAPGTDDYDDYTVVDFGGVAARFVRVTCTSSWQDRGQYGLSEVRFFYTPVSAQNPIPANGAAGVPIDTTLRWLAGLGADSHQVYFGTDPNALTLVDTVSTSSYTPTGLLFETQYYWRIDEVNTTEAGGTWTGEVWTFSTSDTLVVDDFESYDDDWENLNRIFQVWIDGAGYTQPEPGLAGNGSGALVGTSDAPWVERSIVHGGGQSMPLTYNNMISPFYSEATRTFDKARDWTVSGITRLSLWFYGAPGNAGQLYVRINDGAKLYYPGAADDIEQAGWLPFHIDLAAAGTDLTNVTKLTIGIEGASASGTLLIDDICLDAQATALRSAAMLVANVNLSNGFDQAQRDRLVSMGYDVTVVPGGDIGSKFTKPYAETFDLLLISESLGSKDADPLIGANVPMLHNESYGWDNHHFTGPPNSAPAWVGGTTTVDIVNATHPIVVAAGLGQGPLQFYIESTSVNSAERWTADFATAIAPGGKTIAQVNSGGSDYLVVFAIDQGAELADFSLAANRIVGFSLPGSNSYAAGEITDEAWALWETAVRWLDPPTL